MVDVRHFFNVADFLSRVHYVGSGDHKCVFTLRTYSTTGFGGPDSHVVLIFEVHTRRFVSPLCGVEAQWAPKVNIKIFFNVLSSSHPLIMAMCLGSTSTIPRGCCGGLHALHIPATNGDWQDILSHRVHPGQVKRCWEAAALEMTAHSTHVSRWTRCRHPLP